MSSWEDCRFIFSWADLFHVLLSRLWCHPPHHRSPQPSCSCLWQHAGRNIRAILFTLDYISSSGLHNKFRVQSPGENVRVQFPSEKVSVRFPGDKVRFQSPGEKVRVQSPGEKVRVQFSGDKFDVQFPGEKVSIRFPDDKARRWSPCEKIRIQPPGEIFRLNQDESQGSIPKWESQDSIPRGDSQGSIPRWKSRVFHQEDLRLDEHGKQCHWWR